MKTAILAIALSFFGLCAEAEACRFLHRGRVLLRRRPVVRRVVYQPRVRTVIKVRAPIRARLRCTGGSCFTR